MKTIWFFLLAILLFPISTAINFSISAPSEVKINQEFTLAINSQAAETHDVKIFAYQDEPSSIISEIKKAGQWTNPFYYLKEAFPSQKEFEIRIIKAPGKRELCARLRQAGKSSYTQQCTNITILESNIQEETEKNKSEANPAQPKPQEQAKTNQTIEPSSKETNSTTITNSENEKIILNPKLSDPKEYAFTTREGNKHLYALYTFTIFCIILIILLALRKL